jgi:hypothetical protein
LVNYKYLLNPKVMGSVVSGQGPRHHTPVNPYAEYAFMSNQRPDQERWEIFFLTILLATRPTLLRGGLIILLYAVVTAFLKPTVSLAALLLAAYVFLLVYSDRAALYTARVGSWLATVWKRRE